MSMKGIEIFVSKRPWKNCMRISVTKRRLNAEKENFDRIRELTKLSKILSVSWKVPKF